MTSAASLDEVVELFDRFAGEHYDEVVSQLEHALQTAALAVADEASDPLVAAALLHDVGHLLEMREGGSTEALVDVDLAHEARGAQWLASLFPASVTGPIALHVEAKRYRCAVDPAFYSAGLSTGSKRSLELQGGPMSPDEVERFEADPHHVDAVRLRGWDDDGKVVDLTVWPFEHYLPLLRSLSDGVATA